MHRLIRPVFFSGLILVAGGASMRAANPIITDLLTADPAAMVYDGTVYLYTGHDEAPDRTSRYVMKDWLCFSSTDMVNWNPRGAPLAVSDFAWAKSDAWAGQVIERDGKFFWYAPVSHATIHGFAIGVAVADNPAGPFKDARGSAIITNDMTTDALDAAGHAISWDDIDPTVFIDDDGQAYLFWGNTKCRYLKLKANMIEADGPIVPVEGLPHFTEAPWIHKHNGLYYLSYAYGFPEKTAYATAQKITGPWTFRGVIKQLAGNCNTNHQAIIEFKGRSYFIYHNGGTPQGGSFRRSVCIEYLDYNPDGTIKPIVETSEGVGAAAKQ
jgi:beta-xylosidase